MPPQSTDGSHEIQAAKQCHEAPTKWSACAALLMDAAQSKAKVVKASQMMEMANNEKKVAESHVMQSQKEMKEVKEFMDMVEKRWVAIGVDSASGSPLDERHEIMAFAGFSGDNSISDIFAAPFVASILEKNKNSEKTNNATVVDGMVIEGYGLF